ncbi:hypothetical protein [Cerasicoccus fimbriatus]|uniref:hypothetical protein n=1 Tax=Cerasicoccus fimbriatus TaxID=3014554 RepID=UPI0022B53C4F|nr:hypothetical protein [Cerasicoccus sp. TK19100]
MLCLGMATVFAGADSRVWTDRNGRQVEAGLLSQTEEAITIRRDSDGLTFTLPIASLSDADQAYLLELQAAVKPTEPEKPFEGLEWPRRVKLPDDYDVTIVKEDNATNEYIYRTPNFEFHSDVKLARKTVREFGKIFETTYVAMQAFPLEWKPQPRDSHFVTRLFAEKEDYYEAGGMINSGGVYIPSRGEILTPLSSLGVEKASSSYTLSKDGDHLTLIHEITHQVHHDWLNKLPPWIVEGMAVYMESVPYDDGQFRFDRRELEDFHRLQRGGDVLMVAPDELMTMTYSQWSANFKDSPDRLGDYYLSAFLLWNYFLHLDGEGEGRRVYQYCRAVEKGSSDEEARAILLGDRSYEELDKDIIAAYKREGVSIVMF